MSRPRWRWEEKDFGFRFRSRSGKRVVEHYQTGAPGDFYVIPTSQRISMGVRGCTIVAIIGSTNGSSYSLF